MNVPDMKMDVIKGYTSSLGSTIEQVYEGKMWRVTHPTGDTHTCKDVDSLYNYIIGLRDGLRFPMTEDRERFIEENTY